MWGTGRAAGAAKVAGVRTVVRPGHAKPAFCVLTHMTAPEVRPRRRAAWPKGARRNPMVPEGALRHVRTY